MKTVGLYEAKTRLSEICAQVARTRVPVVITRRGSALVSIEPAGQRASIRERRAAYVARYGAEERDDPVDFEPAARSRERSMFRIQG